MKHIAKICLLAGLLLCSADCSKPESGTSDKLAVENEACENSDNCQLGLVCYEKVCHKICNRDTDCNNGTQVCRNTVCITNTDSECALSENCTNPAPCESKEGAQCLGGKCLYKKLAAGSACSNNDACVINETCDAEGHCGNGQPKECPEKYEIQCMDGNSLLRVYNGAGTCQSKDNVGCVYNYKDYPCADCETNKDECHQCDSDEDCVHTWKECFSGKCENGKCLFSGVTQSTPCGHRCVNGINYRNFGECDINSDKICQKADDVSCGGFQCKADGSDCMTDCNGNDDCLDSHYCADKKCQAKGADGDECQAILEGGDCLSGHCGHISSSGKDSCCAGTNCCEIDNDCPSGFGCNRAIFTCEPAGDLPGKADGADCDASSECRSSNCIDGVCCRHAACGECEYCGQDGECFEVAKNEKDPDTCAAEGQACNGSGSCLLSNGSACQDSDNNSCISGFCVDGVCCENACLTADKCDSGANQAFVYVCQAGSGECEEIASPCGSNGCDANNKYCKGSCNSNSDCTSDKYCAQNGICTAKLTNGQTCIQTKGNGTDGSCQSNICSEEGVCCNNKCSGSCQSCKLSGKTGTCSPTDDYSSCGAFKCDTSGKCKNSCSADTDCDSNYYCYSGGQCIAKKGQSVACDQNNECKSKQCFDGVCCDRDCSTNCYSCNLAGSKGTCSAVNGTTDDTTCSGNNICKDGSCVKKQGQSCSLASECYTPYCTSGHCCTTNSCQGQTCQGNATVTYSCGTNGNCEASSPVACSTGYTCVNNACKTSCSVDSDCASGYYCTDSKCIPPCSKNSDCSPYGNYYCNTGKRCTPKMAAKAANVCSASLLYNQADGADSVCTSGHCVDGFCCDTACPSRTCPTDNWSYYVYQCNTDYNGAKKGTCVHVGGNYCQNGYHCATDGLNCANDCSTSTPCRSGYYCDSGHCYNLKNIDASCKNANECKSGHCYGNKCTHGECPESDWYSPTDQSWNGACLDLSKFGVSCSNNTACTGKYGSGYPTYVCSNNNGSSKCAIVQGGADVAAFYGCTIDNHCAGSSTCVRKVNDGQGTSRGYCR